MVTSESARGRRAADEVLAEGLAAPADVPSDIFEAALRSLTSKHGPVQHRHGAPAPGIDRPTLAHVIVPLGERVLYADAIADDEPDVDLAVEVPGRLLS